MKLRFLLFLLLIPQLAFSYYVYHPCCCGRQWASWWGSLDYMYMWRKNRFYPALATSNPTVLPILSDPATTILFGDERVGGKPKSGGRFDVGVWFCPNVWGIGGGMFGLLDEKVKFHIDGTGAGLPIFGRPYFNTVLNIQVVEADSFPGLALNGKIDINTVNYLFGYDLYARRRAICRDWFKLDFLAGAVFNRLQDNLEIETFANIPGLGLNRTVEDRFVCRNDYYGGLLGFYSEARWCKLALTVTTKVALGQMDNKTHISGTTLFTNSVTNAIVIDNDSGLLAQPSNIGKHHKKRVEIIPQINASLQYRFKRCLWTTVGYTYMFWPAVALAGEQVNLNINPTQAPGPVTPPALPVFEDKTQNFWIHGVTGGIYLAF